MNVNPLIILKCTLSQFQHVLQILSMLKSSWYQLNLPFQLSNYLDCRHAVLWELTHEIGCRGIFSTHYHRLATEHESDPTVRFQTLF